MLPEFTRIKDHFFWLTAFVIAKNTVTREHQNSFLGMLWMVIMPLIHIIIFSTIMPLIMARQIENYALYLVASLPLWTFISGSITNACNSILHQAETIKRCIVPAVVFPMAEVMKQFYTYLVSFFTMYIFCALFYSAFHWQIIFLPLLLIPVFFTVMAIAIAVSFAAPYVRDVGYLINIAMSMLFWFTPIVYPLSHVPEHLQWLFWLNPFYVLIHPVQQLVYTQTLPHALDLIALFIVFCGAVVVSGLFYRICRRNYVYYL